MPGQAGAPGGDEIALAQRLEPAERVVGHDRGEEDRGDHQIDRDGGEAHRWRLVHPGDQREHAADIVEQQQQRQRQQLLREADARSARRRRPPAGRRPRRATARSARSRDEAASSQSAPRLIAAYEMRRPAVPAGPRPPRWRRARSIGVLVLGHQRERRLEQDVEVEQHRPVLDVVEIVLDAALDLVLGVGLAAPAIDLRPAGDAGLDLVAGEIAVDDLVIGAVLRPWRGPRAGAGRPARGCP